MRATIDTSDVAGRITAPRSAEGARECVAVVVPLVEGRSEVVRDFLEEGPPFDPGSIGLLGHKVFLTEREAVFVFETESCALTFERILAEPEFWDAESAWERCAAGAPRVGAAVYEWPERRRTRETPAG